jgi:predicted dehydrogenase
MGAGHCKNRSLAARRFGQSECHWAPDPGFFFSNNKQYVERTENGKKVLSMKRLRVAVIGVGALGRHHARIVSELDGVELVAVADSQPERGQDVAAKHKTRWVADYRELLDEQIVDAVSVVVPTVAHRAVAGAFLEKRIPVLVEKPLAGNVSHARELVDFASRNKALLQVGHIERFNPAFQSAQKVIASPKYIRCERTSTYTFRSTDIGVVLDLMIHDIDLVLALVKSPLRRCEAFGIGVIGQNEDAAQARLYFENGCIADLTASRISPTASRSMTAWSASGCVTVDMHQREVKSFSPGEALRHGTAPLIRAAQPGADLEALKKDVFGHFVKIDNYPVDTTGPDALTQELSEFSQCVINGTQPLVDGHQALEAMIVAGKILEQIASHQWEGHPHGAVGPYPGSAESVRKAG